MASLADNIAGLVRAMVEPLLDFPEDLVLTADTAEDETIYIEIHVNPDDTGHVIGRQGRTIKAIRNLARAAVKNGTPVEVEIVD